MTARSTRLIWAVGSRLPRGVAEAIAIGGATVASLLRPAGVRRWEANVEATLGRPPRRAERRRMIRWWARNNLWSLSLARWSDAEVLRRTLISDEDLQRLRTSLAGPGLVLALPHMGSWDLAGAWCARVGIRAVSVAERLPDGLFELFRDARAGMGMEIFPVDQPGLMDELSAAVRARKAVCLLSDRDLGRRGVAVDWAGHRITVPPGPALLALRTGADLRTTTTHFEGGRVRLRVSEPIPHDGAQEMMAQVAEGFVDAVRADPSNWLVLQPFVR
ncbi:MAG TPA: hypothetical protein PKE40_07740 [Arachnia sp.]|nr:hypothetical protein [Arachnia sp.]HMT86227.1 hypothetical protein [Arachnia sp.]